ncbi:polar amino acid ABC transporter ATP-binding protein, partial [Salmonella enterica subsp. enterica serovar Virchow]|nr:polar amino acid ABC transporter ATP-binding protein [Salmonella enterica subsp. enterica serovar Virchow]EBW1603900.1 polar amino acid ABC transporter ATP-binding protein [Salmonella enterica subsp. enterica serovar Kottbus]
MTSSAAMVEVRGARKSYGSLEVLKGIDLSV